MKAVKEINIYLLKKRNAQSIDVVQYDTGIQLVFNVLDFDIPAGTTATLYVQKPSGKFVYQQENISIVDNTIVIALENQAITEHGKAPYQITLTNGNDEISTFSGVLCVEKSLKNAGAVESKTVIKAFDEVVAAKFAEFQNRAETAASAVIATIPDDYTTLSAKVNELANGIKGHLSGAVVRVDDASPIEHLMKVKVVCPEGVDPLTVKVTRCEKNLINLPNRTETDYTGYYFTFITDFEPIVGEIYTLSFDITTTTLPCLIGVGCGSQAYSSEFTPYIKKTISENGRNNITFVWSLTEEQIELGYTKLMFRLPRYSAESTFTATIKNIQLEVGTIATDFEPYSGTEYMPNADGTVNGITSLSPNMTLLTDTDGVTIECEYIKDTNKVIAKIADALNITI